MATDRNDKIKQIICNNKELAIFMSLTYIDKFLIFLLPLFVLYVTNDTNCYNDIEYIYIQ